jgi:hypothetical protein
MFAGNVSGIGVGARIGSDTYDVYNDHPKLWFTICGTK